MTLAYRYFSTPLKAIKSIALMISSSSDPVNAAPNITDDSSMITTVTVHLAEKTTRKILNRLKKLDVEVLDAKIETTRGRATQLTAKLVRARKELQDLETAKYHIEHPDEVVPKKKRSRSPAGDSSDDEAPIRKPRAKAVAKPSAVVETTDAAVEATDDAKPEVEQPEKKKKKRAAKKGGIEVSTVNLNTTQLLFSILYGSHIVQTKTLYIHLKTLSSSTQQLNATSYGLGRF